jgi:hypothetical protein
MPMVGAIGLSGNANRQKGNALAQLDSHAVESKVRIQGTLQ